jgi:hypothetical protein
MLAPMLPNEPLLVKCPSCGKLLWIDEAKKLGETGLLDEKKSKWPGAVEPNLPTEADYMSVLGRLKVSRERELYLRRQAWWAANDLIRTTMQHTVNWSAMQQANLRALANLMDENEPEDRLAKAEIYRELKEFDSCINLLKGPFEKERHAEVAAFIRGLAEQNLSGVREIPEVKAKLESVGYGTPLVVGIGATAILLPFVVIIWLKRRAVKASASSV